MSPEAVELISLLETAGWIRNDESSSVLSKNNSHFDILQDKVKNHNNGAEVDFQGHDSGVRVRLKMAEHFANGTF